LNPRDKDDDKASKEDTHHNDCTINEIVEKVVENNAHHPVLADLSLH
jgi:hypothetical protein